ncbi:MAG TPA: Hpt domain-containing protein, partial [Gemmatimonadaceae bacterium]|nr:Hpt domain-containing protein [Gemmatimonadaceae bacterium]
MNTQRYAELFRAEARERLAEMNTSLLALERGEGADRVAELFRAVHTVKGMAAAMGYVQVRDLSHALEALLDLLRRGVMPVTPAVIETLFESVDTLESAIVAVSQDANEEIDVSSAVASLETMIASADVPVDGVNPTMEWPVMRASDPTPTVPQSVTKTFPVMAAPAEKNHRFVRVDAARLDTLMTLIGELVIARGRLQDVARRAANPALSEAVLEASRLIGSLQTEITT